MAEVTRVLELSKSGLTDTAIAHLTQLPRATVRDWTKGRVPGHSRDNSTSCAACGAHGHDRSTLPASYPYLLGMYLGDGCISIHARGVARLRIHLDLKYPRIIEECKRAIGDAVPNNRVHCELRSSNYTKDPKKTSVVVSAYSKSWVCLLPQHGPGRKHLRVIRLEPLQADFVETNPGLLLRGLIHSDGCRFINTGRNWQHPRYSFRNKSEDILRMFEEACEVLALHTTRAPQTVYVSRKRDVAVLDQHVGPKT